jgi:RHS repeat-associated protein
VTCIIVPLTRALQLAQVDPTGTHWTYTDHLGTPLIQTDTNGTVTWQAEYEPYGSVYALRAGDVHQPLRLPGQSAEQFDMGANGFSPLSYNNERWYQPTWGQYTQPDPMGLSTGPNPYVYVDEGPISQIDPLGLDVYAGFHFVPQTEPVADAFDALTGIYVNAGHLFIEITSNGKPLTLSGEPSNLGFLNSKPDADVGKGVCFYNRDVRKSFRAGAKKCGRQLSNLLQ